MPNIITLRDKIAILKCLHKLETKGDVPMGKKERVDAVAEIFSVGINPGFKFILLQYVSFQVSDRLVYKIIKSNQNGQSLQTTATISRKKTDTFSNYIFRKDLQQQIWTLNLKNEFFSLNSLLNLAKENLDFKGGRTTLFKILKSMGYKYRKVNGRKILCEQKHIVAAKIKFLRKFLEFQNSNENTLFVYLDETWIYQNGTAIRRWMHETDLKSNPSKFVAEGKRFTILHAGCELGFLPGCDYLLDSTNNDRDYHKTMNGQIFQNWITGQLLPALALLERKCVVVMDNAPYHSMIVDKPPTFSSNKREMQEWLVKHNVNFHNNFTKKQLFGLIKPFSADKKRYVIDELLQQNGHEVLRLPPYHCQYNPIEMAWGFCKGYYNKHINSRPSSKDRVANLWRESITNCTPEMWQNYCRHTTKEITDDWTKNMGNLSFDDVPPVIIALGESDSESDTFLSDDESELNASDSESD